jgi:hypothetical protein
VLVLLEGTPCVISKITDMRSSYTRVIEHKHVFKDANVTQGLARNQNKEIHIE